MIRLKKVLVLRKSIALKLIKDPCLLPGCVYKAFPPGKYWLSKIKPWNQLKSEVSENLENGLNFRVGLWLSSTIGSYLKISYLII